jgi:hypothetical protein
VTAAAIVWAALAVALLLLFVVTARRMSALAARTRELERIQRSVESIDRRLAAVADPLVVRLDGIRRHAGDAEGLAHDLVPARATLEDLAAEARTLQLPVGFAAQASVMVHETERAVRAVDMVAHGLDTMLVARRSFEVESQTSLKRGALNLRHAREAFGRAAAVIAALQPADLAPGALAGAERPSSQGGTTFGESADAGIEGPFEPRM